MNKRELLRAERAVYRAIDALILLEELGLGSSETEQALELCRRLESRIVDTATSMYS